MGNKPKCALDEVIEAIKGSDGIKTVIGNRLGVCRQTVTSYLNRWATAQKAYEDELANVLDMSESVVIRNVKLALKKQQNEQVIVDSSDAKWVLTMKGAGRGYAPKQRLDLTSDDKPLEPTKITIYEYADTDSAA